MGTEITLLRSGMGNSWSKFRLSGMRGLILSVAVLHLIATSSRAAPQCASADDQTVYEVLSLRTQMILLATKCGRVQDYNEAFILRFQPVLQANERAVLAYFTRTYGAAGRVRKDSFATELVNVMTKSQGAEFCARAGLIVGELNALRSTDELASYAVAKHLAPLGMTMCALDSMPTTTTGASPASPRATMVPLHRSGGGLGRSSLDK